MNQQLTELIFILDRSGSMYGLEHETIAGYNSMLERQKNEDGDAKVTTVLFDNLYEIIHDAVDIQSVEPMTSKEYYPRGTTALMDAIGNTINRVGNRLAATPEHERPGQVVVVITTDGYENSSREFARNQIKQMIEHQTNTYSWKFMFLGANIDAATEANSIGISADFATRYTASDIGTKSVYACVDSMVSSIRSTGSVDCTLAASYSAAEAAVTASGHVDKAILNTTSSADSADYAIRAVNHW